MKYLPYYESKKRNIKPLHFYFILISFAVVGCQESVPVSQESPVETKDATVNPIPARKNQVTFSVHDTVKSFFTNLLMHEFQDKPDMLYLGSKEKKTQVTVPTSSPIKLLGGMPFFSLHYTLECQPGDEIDIELQPISIAPERRISYPTFSLLNATQNWNETNFGYLLYVRNIKTKAIYFKDPQQPHSTQWNSQKIYTDAVYLLDSLKQAEAISNVFYEQEKMQQKFRYADQLVRTERTSSPEQIAENLSISLNETNFLASPAYIKLLKSVLLSTYFENKRRVPFTSQFEFVLTQKTFLEPTSRLAILSSYLKSIYRMESQEFETSLEKFYAVCNDDSLINYWQQTQAFFKEQADAQNAANLSTGSLTNLTNDATVTFGEVLESQKGKVVLVDFWASWCSPCRRELPATEALKTKLKADEFQVIAISIDKDADAWKRACEIEELADEPHNYLISNWEKSDLYKTYRVKTIPRYLLYDQHGNIVSDDAPRPSDDSLLELIQKQLEKG